MLAGHSAPLAAVPAPRPDRATLLPLLRLLIFGAALGLLCLLALSRAAAVGAAAPANCIPINQTSCLSNGVIYTNGAPTANIGLPNSTVVPGYAVGIGYPPFGFGGFVGANFFSPFFGSPANFFSENFGYLGTNCDPKAWWCLNYEYTGNVFSNLFSPGTGAATINTPAVNTPAGNAPAGTPGAPATPIAPYRAAEVAQPVATTMTAAPVAAPSAPPAPAAQMATALNVPTPAQAPVAPGGGGVKILSVQTTTAPLANNDGRDDGK